MLTPGRDQLILYVPRRQTEERVTHFSKQKQQVFRSKLTPCSRSTDSHKSEASNNPFRFHGLRSILDLQAALVICGLGIHCVTQSMSTSDFRIIQSLLVTFSLTNKSKFEAFE